MNPTSLPPICFACHPACDIFIYVPVVTTRPRHLYFSTFWTDCLADQVDPTHLALLSQLEGYILSVGLANPQSVALQGLQKAFHLGFQVYVVRCYLTHVIFRQHTLKNLFSTPVAPRYMTSVFWVH